MKLHRSGEIKADRSWITWPTFCLQLGFGWMNTTRASAAWDTLIEDVSRLDELLQRANSTVLEAQLMSHDAGVTSTELYAHLHMLRRHTVLEATSSDPAESSKLAGWTGDWIPVMVLRSSCSVIVETRSISFPDTCRDPRMSVESPSCCLERCWEGRDLWSTLALDDWEGGDLWSTVALADCWEGRDSVAREDCWAGRKSVALEDCREGWNSVALDETSVDQGGPSSQHYV